MASSQFTLTLAITIAPALLRLCRPFWRAVQTSATQEGGTNTVILRALRGRGDGVTSVRSAESAASNDH